MLKELGVKRKYLILLIFRIPFEALRTIVNSVFLQKAFTAVDFFDEKKLSLVCVMFFIECAFLFAYNGTVWRVFGTMYAHMQGKIKQIIMENLVQKPMEELENHSSGDILVRADTDAQKAVGIFGEPFNLVFLLNGFFNLISSSILMILVSPKLFLLVIAFVIPHVCLSTFVIAPMQYKIQSKIQKKAAELTDLFTSYINMEEIIHLYNASDFLKRKMEIKNNELKKLNVQKAVYSAAGQFLMPLFGLSGYLVIMLTGGSMIAAGTLTYATLLYVCQLRGGILPASIMIINSAINIKENMVSMYRVQEIIK